jgi:hypothetical protein
VVGEGLKSRVKRLEGRGRQWVGGESYGVPPEQVREEFMDIPRQIAEEALEIRKELLAGNPPPLDTTKVNGKTITARTIAVWQTLGEEHVPAEWVERSKASDYHELNEEGQQLMRDLKAYILSSALELYEQMVKEEEESSGK